MRARRGQVLAEVAVCMPLLVVLLLAVLDFGAFLNAKVKMDHACREGVLAVCRGLDGKTAAQGAVAPLARSAVRVALGEDFPLADEAIRCEAVEEEDMVRVTVETLHVYRPMLPFLWMKGGHSHDRVPVRVRMSALVGKGMR